MPRTLPTSFARLALAAALLAASPEGAAAHPHVWIEARAVIGFDSGGRLAEIRHSWTFDRAYSAFATMGLDQDRDGRPDHGRLQELAREHLSAIAALGHFTVVKVDVSPVELGPPTGGEYTFSDERLTLRFVLALVRPVAHGSAAVEIADPSFFVAVGLAEGAEAVRMENAPEGCELTLRRPEGAAAEAVRLLADEIADALGGRGGEGPGPKRRFGPQIVVRCP